MGGAIIASGFAVDRYLEEGPSISQTAPLLLLTKPKQHFFKETLYVRLKVKALIIGLKWMRITIPNIDISLYTQNSANKNHPKENIAQTSDLQTMNVGTPTVER